MKNYIQCLANLKASQQSNKSSGIYRWLILMLILFVESIAVHAQIAPVTFPNGGFHIDGNLISNTPTSGVGDWVSGSGTGGFVFDNDGSSVNPLRSQLFSICKKTAQSIIYQQYKVDNFD